MPLIAATAIYSAAAATTPMDWDSRKTTLSSSSIPSTTTPTTLAIGASITSSPSSITINPTTTSISSSYASLRHASLSHKKKLAAATLPTTTTLNHPLPPIHIHITKHHDHLSYIALAIILHILQPLSNDHARVLRLFVRRIIAFSHSTVWHVIVAGVYLIRLRDRYGGAGAFKGSEGFEFRLFCVALILAHKISSDEDLPHSDTLHLPPTTTTTRDAPPPHALRPLASWSCAANIPVTDLRAMEREFLGGVEYRCALGWEGTEWEGCGGCCGDGRGASERILGWAVRRGLWRGVWLEGGGGGGVGVGLEMGEVARCLAMLREAVESADGGF
ncbi:hypothetical protein BC829DRAFT_487336 [Chytridium lagenaria]|nr:hypothetical protein BC829DRAFT_487336 [Chytridium lagenaria]